MTEKEHKIVYSTTKTLINLTAIMTRRTRINVQQSVSYLTNVEFGQGILT